MGAPIRAFVIGHPIAHSRSPLIHGHWLRAFGIAGSYERIDVRPDGLAAFVRGFPMAGFVGGNVTVPHKEAVLALVNELTPTARRLGAVNTLSLAPAGGILGHNTDGEGFVRSLDEAVGPTWSGGPAVVIGAGGAARAIVGALLDRGVPRLTIVNRTLQKAEALRAFDPDRIVAADRLETADLAAASLVVNATSLGAAGQPPLDIELTPCGPDTVVADIVYVPAQTPLLCAARARGLRAVGGLGMLLHQAVPGFETWFRTRPQVTPALRRLVEADIAMAA